LLIPTDDDAGDPPARRDPFAKETIMAEFGTKKLADSVPHVTGDPVVEGHHGRPVPDHATDAEQSREAQESGQAHDAEASIRGKMVDIGRGNQQAGRQGQ
jgi:hypothetical protein